MDTLPLGAVRARKCTKVPVVFFFEKVMDNYVSLDSRSPDPFGAAEIPTGSQTQLPEAGGAQKEEEEEEERQHQKQIGCHNYVGHNYMAYSYGQKEICRS